MIQNLENIMELQINNLETRIDKMQEKFNKDQEEIKKSQPIMNNGISLVQFSRSVMCNSLRPHESQHARPPCPSPTPGVYSNSCPLCWWHPPAITFSGVPFSSCPQSLPASGSFPMNQIFSSGGQSILVSAWASFLPMNTQDWSSLGRTGWLKSLLQHEFKSINSLALSLLHNPTLTSIYDYWKNHSFE